MTNKYPQYRVSQWIDTSAQAMAKEQATIIYGVQIKKGKGAPWAHVHQSGDPLFFDSASKATEAIKALPKGE